MSTSGFGLYRGSPSFSRTVGSAPDTARSAGAKTVKKKRELFPGLPPVSPGSFALPPAAESQFGNFNPIPFRWTVRLNPSYRITSSLRID
eukprot:31465-Pelagococcus_subviridis.AAC.2